MVNYEYIIVTLGCLFLIADYLLQKHRYYKYLRGKLKGAYALNTAIYNFDYIYKYKKITNILNYIILNMFFYIKLSIVFAILFYIVYESLTLFALPFILLLILDIIIYVTKKTSLKKKNSLELAAALEEWQPSFVFYFSAPSAKFSYHIKMWFPYLKLLDLKFYIMIREKKHLKPLLAFADDTPIVVASSLGHIERYLPDSVKMAFYANNGTNNTHLVRFNQLLHIQLLHGDSEKPPSFNPVSKMYDKLFVSGQRAIDRYEENNVIVPKGNFEIIGRPQISNIKLNEHHNNNEIYTVLIAPTWVGFHEDTKFSSLLYIYDVVKYLLSSKQKIKIILRLHPLTNRNDKKTSDYLKDIEDLLKNGSHIIYSDNEIVDDFNESDCLITDVSSVPIDYLYSLKPIIHIDVNELSAHFKTDKRYKQYETCVYLINENYTNLGEVFNFVFTNDILFDKRKIVKSYYHGSFNKPLEEVFVSTTKYLYEKHINNKCQKKS